MTYKEIIAWLPADEFVSLFSEWFKKKEKKKKRPNTFFIFFSFGATPSISRAKSNGKSSARAFLHDADADMHSCMKGKRTSRGELSAKPPHCKTRPGTLLLSLLNGSKEAF